MKHLSQSTLNCSELSAVQQHGTKSFVVEFAVGNDLIPVPRRSLSNVWAVCWNTRVLLGWAPVALSGGPGGPIGAVGLFGALDGAAGPVGHGHVAAAGRRCRLWRFSVRFRNKSRPSMWVKQGCCLWIRCTYFSGNRTDFFFFFLRLYGKDCH